MSQLEEDLEKDYERMREAFNTKDIITGLMILAGMTAELAAVIAIVIGAINVIGIISGGLGYLGLPVSGAAISYAVRRAVPEIVKQYSSLNQEKRKALKMSLVFLGISPSIFDI